MYLVDKLRVLNEDIAWMYKGLRDGTHIRRDCVQRAKPLVSSSGVSCAAHTWLRVLVCLGFHVSTEHSDNFDL